MRLASLLPLLRTRRSFCDVERRSRNPMSSLGQCRWWYDNRSLASWLSLDADCQLALSAGAMTFADLISAKCTRVCDALQPSHSLYVSTVTDFFDLSWTSDILDAMPPRSRWSDTSPGTIEGTGGEGTITQWVHAEYIVGSEKICPAFTQQVRGGYFSKVPTKVPTR